MNDHLLTSGSPCDHQSWTQFLESKKQELQSSPLPRSLSLNSTSPQRSCFNSLDPPTPPSPLSPREPHTSPPTINKQQAIQSLVNRLVSHTPPHKSPSRSLKASSHSPKRTQTVSECLKMATDLGIKVLEPVQPRQSIKYPPSTPLPKVSRKTPNPNPNSNSKLALHRSPKRSPSPVQATKQAQKRITEASHARREKTRKQFWRVVKEARELREFDRQLIDECNLLCHNLGIFDRYYELVDSEILEDSMVRELKGKGGRVVKEMSMSSFRREHAMLQSQSTSFSNQIRLNESQGYFDRIEMFEKSKCVEISRAELLIQQQQILSSTTLLVKKLKEQIQHFEDCGGFY
ncbi:hypothetical protein P9112_009723 [Eukaryota sp. TZLM1-RC]